MGRCCTSSHTLSKYYKQGTPILSTPGPALQKLILKLANSNMGSLEGCQSLHMTYCWLAWAEALECISTFFLIPVAWIFGQATDLAATLGPADLSHREFYCLRNSLQDTSEAGVKPAFWCLPDLESLLSCLPFLSHHKLTLFSRTLQELLWIRPATFA